MIPDSIVYSDSFKSYNVLDIGEFKHYRINHSKQFTKVHNHINGIVNFWNQAKRHMRQFNGIPKENFELFLKECEWRFNTPNYKEQLSLLKSMVKGNSMICAPESHLKASGLYLNVTDNYSYITIC